MASTESSSPGRPTDTIVLIGPPGSGKTVCGKALAQSLSWSFLDTDQVIEEQSGLTIPELFAQAGEAHFRKLEKELLLALSESPAGHLVIATGGGMPVAPGNWERLKLLGPIIWLQADQATLLARLKNHGNRPLLRSGRGQTEGEILDLALSKMLQERAAVYALADYAVDTTSLSPEAVAQAIVKVLGMPS